PDKRSKPFQLAKRAAAIAPKSQRDRSEVIRNLLSASVGKAGSEQNEYLRAQFASQSSSLREGHQRMTIDVAGAIVRRGKRDQSSRQGQPFMFAAGFSCQML